MVMDPRGRATARRRFFKLEILLGAYLVTRRDLVRQVGTAIGSSWARIAGELVRPNIVFVLIDDLRYDDLGISGPSWIRTPNIDRLAREGVWFENAFVTSPLCSPSRGCFLTGQY